MGIYREHTRVMTGDEEWDSWELFEQPALLHAVIKLTQAVTSRTHGLEWRLDPLAQRLHDRHCNDDCQTGTVSRIKPYWRTPEGQAERAKLGFITPMTRPDMWETRVETMCGRLPLCADVDLRVERFTRRHRRSLGTLDGARRPRVRRTADAPADPPIRFSAALTKRMRR